MSGRVAKDPAIVATLGTLGLYRGIMLLWTGGKWIEGLPAELKQLSAPLLFGVSAIGWLTIILVAFMAGCWQRRRLDAVLCHGR